MIRTVLLAIAAAASLPSGAKAQSRPPIPDAVFAHIDQLDLGCRARGGRAGEGRYIVAQDFTGDGRPDYLISEHEYVCTGRPQAYRRNDGAARIALFVTDADNNAFRAYYEMVVSYEVTAGQPATVQVVKEGAFCRPGAPPQVRCSAQLDWNGRIFVHGPLTIAEPPAASAAPPPPDGGQAEGEPPVDHAQVAASLPAADMLLAVLPAAGQRLTLADLRQQAPGVRWAARSERPYLARGRLGTLEVFVEGRGQPASVSVGWSKIGAEIPYDVANAMRRRGATLVQMSCEKMGAGEGTRLYAGTAPGKAPFTLSVDQRTAPTGGALSRYSAAVSLDGRHPPRGPATGCDF